MSEPMRNRARILEMQSNYLMSVMLSQSNLKIPLQCYTQLELNTTSYQIFN